MTGEKAGPPPQQLLTDMLMRDYHLGQTPGGQPFAVANDTPSVLIPFSKLRNRLSAGMMREHGKPASSSALADVMSAAEGIAYDTRPATPALRIAGRGLALYLDLGRRDGAAVELSPYGWRVIASPPVLFARTQQTVELPLPLPAGSGSADGARELISVSGHNEWALYVACRIASLMPGITHPVELFTGPAGSAKTTTMRISAGWIDPSVAMIPVPRDGRTWAAMAGSAYCLPVDNISYIPAWWSDLLCKAASGDGWVDRALYTDGDTFVSKFQSVVMLNGITLGQIRGDLADRMVVHRLERRSEFRSDDDIEDHWKASHPAALSWLLDQAVRVMRGMMCEPLPRSANRLARFAQVVELVDRAWYTKAADAWARSSNDMATDVAEGDDVAVAIMRSIQMPARMSSQDLIWHLQAHGGLTDPFPGKPWTPHGIAARIERAATPLGGLGWQVQRFRAGDKKGTRVWQLVPPGWAWDGQQWVYTAPRGVPLDAV